MSVSNGSMMSLAAAATVHGVANYAKHCDAYMLPSGTGIAPNWRNTPLAKSCLKGF